MGSSEGGPDESCSLPRYGNSGWGRIKDVQMWVDTSLSAVRLGWQVLRRRFTGENDE